jgi:hypothetical protein
MLDKVDHHASIELMTLNFNIGLQSLLITVAGIIIGCLSALSFQLGAIPAAIFYDPPELTVPGLIALFVRFGPGFVFGLAVAVIYFIKSEQGQVKRFARAVVITVAGVICYQTAFWPTFLFAFFLHDSAFIVAPAVAAIGGFVATYIFVDILQAVTDNKYPIARYKFSLYGGLLGAILIDSIASLMSGAIATNSDVNGLFLRVCIFFIGWQTPMLLIISEPLLKRADNQIAPPAAVAGTVNDVAPR